MGVGSSVRSRDWSLLTEAILAALGNCGKKCDDEVEYAGGGRMGQFPSFKFLVLGTILVLSVYLFSVAITDSLIKSALTSAKPTAAQQADGAVVPSPKQADIPSTGGSSTDGWRVFIDISSPEGGERQGFLPRRFNSKEQCAITADGVHSEMKSLGFIINRIDCRSG